MKNITLITLLLFVFSNINSQNFIYYSSSEDNNIQRKRLNGILSFDEVVINQQNTPRGIAIDYDHGRIYFADGEHNSITVANLDGSNLEYLNDTDEPVDVCFDRRTGFLYFTDVVEGSISSYDYNSSADRTLISGLTKPGFLDIDIVKDHIYFTSKQDNKSVIYRSDLIGNNIVEIIEQDGNIIGIAVDAFHEKLYWLNRNTAKLHSSNLDGSNKTDIANASPVCIALELDNINNKLYWAEKDFERIQVVNTDGTNLKTFLENVKQTGGIALDIKNGCSKIVEIFDTNYITVTDTLLVDVTFTGTDNVLYTNIIKVFPNPTKKYINIDLGEYFSKITDYSISIVNTTGQLIYQNTFNEKLISINIDDFGKNGLYFIQIKNNNGELLDVKKLVLE